jgi:DNA topoisomerase-2
MASEGGAAAPAVDERAAKYRKLTQLEHVTTRSGMYVGSTVPTTSVRWLASLVAITEAPPPATEAAAMETDSPVPAEAADVGDAPAEEGTAAAARRAPPKPKKTTSVVVGQKPVTFVPALLKLFDEVASNALDASVRDPTVTQITIIIDEDFVSVKNNGAGIPIVKKDDVYIPEMIFGHLLTGSNFDDSEAREVAGQNGLGIKLCNIFSDKFTIYVKDSATGSTYEQTWSDGMTRMSSAKIKIKDKPANGFVDVMFYPQKQFLLPDTTISEDMRGLFLKRILDIALVARDNVTVSVNNEKFPKINLKTYARIFMQNEEFLAVCEENPAWRFAVGYVEDGPLALSLANGVSCVGEHLKKFETQLCSKIIEAAKAKRDLKGVDIKPAALKKHLAIFLICTLDSPTFDSQSKETLVSWNTARSVPLAIPEGFIKKIVNSSMLETIAKEAIEAMDKKAAKKTDGKRVSSVNVPKLIDATWAGTTKSNQCSLILTEGDSAKAFAVAGLDVLGHDAYGVFPLKGKLLNTRDATAKQIMENAEIKNIKTILGLQNGKTHDNGAELRYGNVILLTDSDVDGSHIKGLLLNFLHTSWPSLALSGYVKTLQTPLIRATKGSDVRDFFTTAAFDEWADKNGWRVKYYKGLGTWTSAHAKEIFKKQKPVSFLNDNTATDSLLLAFDKTKADDRKEWVRNATATPPAEVDYTRNVTVTSFINQDLVTFAIYSVHRAIPSLCDGLKPSTRKIIYTVMKRGYLTHAKEVKVAQLSGAVAELTLYLHGENSLNEAIIGLAQAFPGTNNLPLLTADGQFGTRLENGSDSASPRYIFTYGSQQLRRLFRDEDDDILAHAMEEGVAVEPQAYTPVLPLILLNGASGIATGFSTFIPSYNPTDIVQNIRNFLADEPFVPMIPFYNGFTGTIVADGDSKYAMKGVYERISENVFKITEIPFTKSFSAYAEWVKDSDKSKLKLLKNKCTDAKCHFEVAFVSDEARIKAETDGLHEAFKLTASLSLKNMHAFNTAGAVTRYATINDMLAEWCAWRLGQYQKRRDHLIEELQQRAAELASKARFVKAVCTKKLDISAHADAELLSLLSEKGFLKPETLVSMPARSFTTDKAKQIEDKAAEALAEAEAMQRKTTKMLWEEDLLKVITVSTS